MNELEYNPEGYGWCNACNYTDTASDIHPCKTCMHLHTNGTEDNWVERDTEDNDATDE